jgi:hypothetical protein
MTLKTATLAALKFWYFSAILMVAGLEATYLATGRDGNNRNLLLLSDKLYRNSSVPFHFFTQYVRKGDA